MSTGAQYVVLGMRTARLAREAELPARLVEAEGAEARTAPECAPQLETERA